MCGRFTLTVNPADLQESFTGFRFPAQFVPRFNIAPTQPILAIPSDGRNTADFFLWGLIPFWAKDPALGSRLINARAETVAKKTSFRTAYKYRRCLIPADGFYEWQALAGTTKIPHYFFLKSRQPFAFAGLWEDWQGPGGSQLRSCTIITVPANALIAPLHKRMPVILPSETYAQWLDTKSRADVRPLLIPYPAEKMDAYPVSTTVNSPQNDRAECVVPA
ncbi:MAG: SOS response-associated peptidase [Anaerolineales bacterium]|nr:SOS response-associated peptidase [Anaerolineales bacterium]